MGPTGREPNIYGFKDHRAIHYATEFDEIIDKNICYMYVLKS